MGVGNRWNCHCLEPANLSMDIERSLVEIMAYSALKLLQTSPSYDSWGSKKGHSVLKSWVGGHTQACLFCRIFWSTCSLSGLIELTTMKWRSLTHLVSSQSFKNNYLLPKFWGCNFTILPFPALWRRPRVREEFWIVFSSNWGPRKPCPHSAPFSSQ